MDQEHKVNMNLRMVNGDKTLFRHWHQRFIIALGQVGGVHEEIIQQLVRETDLGRELDKVVEKGTITGRSLGEFQEMCGTFCWTKRRTSPTTGSS